MCTIWRALPDTRGTVSRLAVVAAWRRSLESRVIPSHSVALGAPRRPFLPYPSSRVLEFPRRKEGHRSVLRDPSVRFPFVSGITRALRFWVVQQTAAEARGAHGFGDRSGFSVVLDATSCWQCWFLLGLQGRHVACPLRMLCCHLCVRFSCSRRDTGHVRLGPTRASSFQFILTTSLKTPSPSTAGI